MAETAPAAPASPAVPAEANGVPGHPAPAPAVPVSEPAAAPVPAAPPVVTPAELVAPPGRRQRVGWYAGTVLLSVLIVCGGYRVDKIDLRVPFAYDADALLILPFVKATVDRGGHWKNERLAAPGEQELYDYPVIDHLHFAIIWAIGRVWDDTGLVYNLYYLLTYPLTALTAMLVFRWVGLTLPAAAVGAMLYTFLPAHYLRNDRWAHYFLAAYWVVPLSVYPVFLLLKGEPPFFPAGPDGRPRFRVRWRTALWVTVLGAATASAGAYYAFFACMLYAIAAVYAAVAFRSWAPGFSAGALCGTVVVFGLVNHAPMYPGQARMGNNPITQRAAEEADIYGLKITHLVLPIQDHNLTVLAQVRSRNASPIRPCENENAVNGLGFVGSAGLVGLLAVLVLPVRKPWPYGPLGAVTGMVLLVAMIGGFGSVFNLLVFDQIRCYNRVGVFLAVFCLVAVLWALDRFLATRRGVWGRRLRVPALLAVGALGLVDQTPFSWFGDKGVKAMREQAEKYYADREFYTKIEDELLAGGPAEPPRVLNLPYCPYPEWPKLYNMDNYSQVRGYLHTRVVRWSYGAPRHRETDAWQRDVSLLLGKDPERFLRRVVAAGFDGVVVNLDGYSDAGRGRAVVDAIRTAAEGRVRLPAEITRKADKAADGRLAEVFLDLRPYARWWRGHDPAEFDRHARAEREWSTITWLKGFFGGSLPEDDDVMMWRVQREGLAVFDNRSDRTRRYRFAAIFGVDDPGPFRVTVAGEGIREVAAGNARPWADEFELSKSTTPPPDAAAPVKPGPDPLEWETRRTYVLEVPPGRHRIRFRIRLPGSFMPQDSYSLCMYMRMMRLEELGTVAGRVTLGGRPQPGTTVYLEAEGAPPRTTTAGAGGAFEFPDSPPRKYTVRTAGAGRPPPRAALQAVAGVGGFWPLTGPSVGGTAVVDTRLGGVDRPGIELTQN